MDGSVVQLCKFLIDNIPSLISKFKYRKGPDLFFYQKTIKLRRKHSLEDLFNDESLRFFELMYATLVSWDMNSRGAKMKYFDNFKLSILKNEQRFFNLSDYELDKLTEIEFRLIKRTCENIYTNLHVMKSSGRLVSNSKIMHYILPDLVMPMDGKNTLNFFFKNAGESKKRFLTILECSHKIAISSNLEKYIDLEWNLSKPKIIDNAIISHMSPKYNK